MPFVDQIAKMHHGIHVVESKLPIEVEISTPEAGAGDDGQVHFGSPACSSRPTQHGAVSSDGELIEILRARS